MENKLIPMTDFTLQKCKFLEIESNDDLKLNMESHFALLSIRRYAQFLKQPLALWMFVPCDENNVPLEKPVAPKNFWESDEQDSQLWAQYQYDIDMYEKAKSRVIFEGFRIVDFEEHQIESLKHTSYLQWDDIDLISKKDWEEEWNFEDYTVEFLLTEPTAEITLTETAKQIYGSKR
ncbi:hypothetical protein HZP59_18510 [Elizabethkingia anophelis]|nr:hypothetical protein [Elizabethkingia anophelis]